MSDGTHLATWVSKDTKERFSTIAASQDLKASALLKRLVELTVHTASGGIPDKTGKASAEGRHSRMTIRLRGDDQILLEARAAARSLKPATYISVLTRAHLRKLTPLPKDELLALKRSISELGAIGRNLNQIARAANRGGGVTGPGKEDLRAILRVCEGLRDHVKALVIANMASWDQGYAEPK